MMPLPSLRWPLSVAALVSLAYLVAGALWILLSDRLGGVLFSTADGLASYQTYKGWFFVAGTAALFYLLLRGAGRSRPAPGSAHSAGVASRYSLPLLLILLVLATAVPLVAMLAYNIRHQAESEVEKAETAVKNLVNLTATDTASTLEEFERLLVLLSSRRGITALDRGQCDDGSREILGFHKSLINVASYDLDGNVICSVLRPAEGRFANMSKAAWFEDLKRRKAFVIGTPQIGVTTKLPVLLLGYPLKDDAGSLRGAVSLVVNLNAFHPLVSGTLPAGAVAGIVDREANLIASTRGAEKSVGTDVGKNVTGSVVSSIVLAQQEGTVVAAGRDGVKRLYAFKPIRKSGWFSVVGVPDDSIYAAGRRTVWQSVLVGLGILLLSSILVVVIHRKISLPMAALTAATGEIAAGRFDLRVPEGGPPEVAQVAHGVNQALGQLQKSEERFRALTSMASDWYWETDAQHRIIDLSEGVEASRVGGSKMEDLVGKTRWELDGVETPPDMMQQHRGQLERHEPFRNFEMARRRPDGRLFSAMISGDPMFDATGKFTGYRGVGRSIMAQREGEARLRDSERYYRMLFDASPDAIRVVCDDRVVMLNPAGMRMYGAGGAVTWPIGELLIDTISPEFHALVRERLREVIEERVAVPISEQTMRRLDGSIIPVEVQSIPCEYEGKPAALAILHDITERKAAERAGAQVNAELEERVQQRTLELRQANKDLEAFSYTVAHDLRAPLRSISGFAALLGETKSQTMDLEALTFLDRIKTSVASMSQLIEGLLSLARLGRVQLRPVKVDLSALASHVAAELQQRDPARAVEWVIQPGVAGVGDLHLLKDVLENLLGNAWKFSSGRELAKIEFGSAAHEAEVAYFVRDNGAGFDPAYASKLFGTFQRLHSAGEFPGIGIGLASVKSIVETHGGKVWAEGAVGAGATFWFTLGSGPAGRDQTS